MIPTIDSVQLDTPAQLTLDTGYSVAWAPGTNTYLTKLDGWTGSAPIRRDKSPLLGGHGSHAERGFKDERLVSVSGHHVAASRGAAARFAEDMAAFLGDGEAGVFAVDDADLGLRWVQAYLAPGAVDVDWSGGVDVKFTVHLLTPDPRKYGVTFTAPATGIPTPGSGLVFPLFQSRPLSTAVRTNWARNPQAYLSLTNFAAWSLGTGEAGTTTFIANAVDGPPEPGVTNYVRRTITTAKTGGSTGWNNSGGTYRALVSGLAGDSLTSSVWIRSSHSISVTPRAYAYNAAGASINSADGTPVVLVPNVWTRLSATVVAAADYASIGWWTYMVATNILPAGATMDATGWLAEVAPAGGSYFDGATPPAGTGPTTANAWTGSAQLSPSVQTITTYQGPSGALDIGAGGYSGKVSLTNTGTADAAPVFTISGVNVPGFTLTHEGSGRRLVYTDTISSGQTLVLDTNYGTATLDGYAPRDTKLVLAEWVRLGRGETGTWLFESPGSDSATMTAEVTPAWW